MHTVGKKGEGGGSTGPELVDGTCFVGAPIRCPAMGCLNDPPPMMTRGVIVNSWGGVGKKKRGALRKVSPIEAHKPTPKPGKTDLVSSLRMPENRLGAPSPVAGGGTLHHVEELGEEGAVEAAAGELDQQGAPSTLARGAVPPLGTLLDIEAGRP